MLANAGKIWQNLANAGKCWQMLALLTIFELNMS
jgi:hypothetical protein